MTPIDPPRLHGSPLGSAQFKSHPDDFQVDEVLGWTPSGEGEHCFLWIQKRGCNSNDVAAQIAKRLKIRKRLISHCGLKDKNAITRQWFSIHLPGIPSPTAEKLQSENFQALKITRNSRKLRRGVHRGNRFAIRLTHRPPPTFAPHRASPRLRNRAPRERDLRCIHVRLRRPVCHSW